MTDEERDRILTMLREQHLRDLARRDDKWADAVAERLGRDAAEAIRREVSNGNTMQH